MWQRSRRRRPAGAGQRGGTRRGSDPLRRRRPAGDGRRPPAGGPRAPRRRRRGDQPRGWRRRPAGVDDHVYLDATAHGRAVLRAVPVDHRGVPVDRCRSGSPANPRRPGRPLRVRWRAGATRRDDGARLGSTPSARCPAPASTAPTGWRRTASPRASSPAPDSAATWRGSCPIEAMTRDLAAVAAGLIDAAPGSTIRTGDVAPRRRAARRRGARRGCRRVEAIVAGTAAVVAPSQAAYEATNVATVASAVLAAATARVREPRMSPPQRPPRAACPSGWSTCASGRRPPTLEPVTVVGGPRSTLWRARHRRCSMFHPLVAATRERLIAGGLDPDAVAAIVRDGDRRGPDGRRRRHVRGDRSGRPAQRGDVRCPRRRRRRRAAGRRRRDRRGVRAGGVATSTTSSTTASASCRAPTSPG